MIERLNSVKMAVFSKLIYRPNEISIKIPTTIFRDGQADNKIHIEFEGMSNNCKKQKKDLKDVLISKLTTKLT